MNFFTPDMIDEAKDSLDDIINLRKVVPYEQAISLRFSGVKAWNMNETEKHTCCDSCVNQYDCQMNELFIAAILFGICDHCEFNDMQMKK